MKQQKKLQSVQYSIYGLSAFCTLLMFWLTSQAVIAQQHDHNLTAILEGSVLTFCIFLITVGVAGWFIYRLVNEVRARRDDDCELYLSEAAVKACTNGILITDDETNVVFVNPAFEEITGYTADDIIGKNPRILSSGRHNKAFFKNMWLKLEKEGRWEGEIWNRRKDGEVYLEWINIIKFPKGLFNTGQYLSIFSDITERKQEEGQQAFQATHDPLTQLPNRNLFFDRVETELLNSTRNQSGLMMMFLDLDEFKAINDTYGHIVGDQVLIDVSKRILQTVRRSDSVCRYGGDEFIVLLPGMDDELVWKRIAEELLRIISRPYSVHEHILTLSTSIGIAIHSYNDTPLSVSEFINIADKAMYKAKVSGKNQYFLTTSQTSNIII